MKRATIAGALVVLIAIVVGLRDSTITPTVLNSGRRVQLDPAGWTQTVATRCCTFAARATIRCLQKAGHILDGGPTETEQYLCGRVCGTPLDAGIDELRDRIPECFDPIDWQCDDSPPDASVHAWESVIGSLAKTQNCHLCACSDVRSDAGCGWWGPGADAQVACPRGVTLNPGTWSGAGAVRKSCIEVNRVPGEFSSMPQECVVP